VLQKENDDVLLDAYLIAHFQTGLKNVLDRAVLKYRENQEGYSIENYRKVDEIPFDFSRRMMSVAVETPDKNYRLLTKGAPESVFPRCTFFELGGEIHPMEPILIGDLMEQYQELSMDGFRVLAVAYKCLPARPTYSREEESELILKGYVAFLDPPKETAEKAITALKKIGVTIKVLTGDNDLGTRKICREVGLTANELLLGSQVETMTDAQLAASAEGVHVFARVSPAHKERIIHALQQNKHVVGFMGDGINDAPALRVADVGISVECWDPSRAGLFQTGWFVESLMTQTLIIHVIRTKKIPFIEGLANWPLTITTILVMGIGISLPFSPLAPTLGFVHLPLLYWPILFVTLLCYVVLTQLVKMWLLRRSWL
jgi:Mg2+-importing ATPase